MTVFNFDLEDGLPKVSFTLNTKDAVRFISFMEGYDKIEAQLKESQECINNLEHELSESIYYRDDVICAAARIANAITDINNSIGEITEVKIAFTAVSTDVENYKGLENTKSINKI